MGKPFVAWAVVTWLGGSYALVPLMVSAIPGRVVAPPGVSRASNKSASFTLPLWRTQRPLAQGSRVFRPGILRGGSDSFPSADRKLPSVLDTAQVANSDPDEVDEEEDPPSKWIFAAVSGLLAACVTAMSMVAKRGASITSLLSIRQELMFLSMLSLFTGYNVCSWLALFARSRMESAKADTTAAIFMQGVVKYGSLAVAATCLLGSLGVNINGLTAALASSGIAVGLASQRVLENLAAGVMLMVFRNFEVGDIVQVAGKMGVVCKITLMATRIDSFSNVRLSIPNKDIFGSVVENFSRNAMRRAEIEVSTAGSSDIQAVRRTVEDVLDKYKHYAAGVIEAKRRRRSQLIAAQRGAMAIAKAQAASDPKHSATLMPGNVTRSAKTARGFMGGSSPVSFKDFINIASYGESKEEQTRSGVQVALPAVVLKDMKTWGYLWEVRVFLPSQQYDGLRCKLVEEIALALRENHVRMVADIVEEKKKIVGFRM